MNILEHYNTCIFYTKEKQTYTMSFTLKEDIVYEIHDLPASNRPEALNNARQILWSFFEWDNLFAKTFDLLGNNVGHIGDFKEWMLDNPNKSCYELRDLWLERFYHKYIVPVDLLVISENIKNPFYSNNLLLGWAKETLPERCIQFNIVNYYGMWYKVNIDNSLYIPSNFVLADGINYNFIICCDANKGIINLTCIDSACYYVNTINHIDYLYKANNLKCHPLRNDFKQINGAISLNYITNSVLEFGKLLLEIGNMLKPYKVLYTNNEEFKNINTALDFILLNLRK